MATKIRIVLMSGGNMEVVEALIHHTSICVLCRDYDGEECMVDPSCAEGMKLKEEYEASLKE